MNMPTLSKCIVFKTTVVFALALLSVSPAFGKRKDDVVVMKNGDKFTGEIKGLQYGELMFKSGYMKDSVHLDWERVADLESKDTYIVTLSDGRRITGTISRKMIQADDKQEFKISAADSSLEIASPEVITIENREASFWNQLTGSIDYGFGFSSGNNTTNSSLGATVAFNTAKNTIALATSSQFDSQANAKNTSRFTFDSQYGREITTNWIAFGLFSMLKSNQQDLNLRTTYGAGFGRRLVQTDRTTLLAIGGGAYSHESYFPQPGTEPVLNNAEALLGLKFSTFRFKTLNINSQNFLFPSLTDLGRFRFSSQSNLRIELLRNFYWNVQFYENYDTRPPVAAPKNDLGLSTSLGWTFSCRDDGRENRL
jgi:putative salt-induced outer membrane protein YdiY